MSTPNSTVSQEIATLSEQWRQSQNHTEPQPDAIDQAVLLLQKFSHGDGLTQTGLDFFDQADATALLASVGIAIAEQLRRIADVMEANHAD